MTFLLIALLLLFIIGRLLFKVISNCNKIARKNWNLLSQNTCPSDDCRHHHKNGMQTEKIGNSIFIRCEKCNNEYHHSLTNNEKKAFKLCAMKAM